MSAFIPNRGDAEATTHALEQVAADKHREVNDGFDGSWVSPVVTMAGELGRLDRIGRRG
jgi:malate synthase